MNIRPLARLSFCALVLLSSAAGLRAQEADAGNSGIQQTMSPEEFRAAGLNKLSKKELANLDAWLRGDREKVVNKVRAQKVKTGEVVLSRVDGPWNGVAGGMVIKLEDGTKWKAANPGDHFSGSGDHPPAVVYHSIFGYKMRVLGTPDFYVDNVRQ